MLFILYIIATVAVLAYFVGFGIVLIFGIIDKQGGTVDNQIVAFMLLIGLIVVPLFGVLTSLPGH